MIISNDDKLQFQITPHLIDGEETYDTVDVKGGGWLVDGAWLVADDAEDIGSSTEIYIIIEQDGSAATISSSATEPTAEEQDTKRCIGKLNFTTMAKDTYEELPDPGMEGTNCLSSIDQYIVGDIYPGGGGGDPSDDSFGVTLIDGEGSADQTVTVEAGTFYIHGKKKFNKGGESGLGLPDADYAYVCVQKTVDLTSDPSFVILEAEPEPSASMVTIPLVRLYRPPDEPRKWQYDAPGHVLHRGDIDFSTALVW